MRIQHNITAMNSYRNFSTNNAQLSKNLEKLSSGYKINRAGDDAAGLAISEKMRAQITGLEGATKNAKDGISLIQTAEGALTEVHSMLNRMVTLSEQSANGTYADEVDREQLQKEVDALKSEIDRVADSTNFNGLKLLDGSLSGGGSLKGLASVEDTIATKAKVATDAALTDVSGLDSSKGDSISYTLSWKDSNGNDQTTSVKFTLSEDNKALVASDGTKYAMATTGTAAAGEIGKAVKAELGKNADVNAAFNIKLTDSDTKFEFEAKTEGTKGAVVTGSDTNAIKNGVNSAFGGNTLNEAKRVDGKDVMQKLNLDEVKVLTKKNVQDTGDAAKAIADNTFEVDGKKFILTKGSGDEYEYFKDKVDADTTIIHLAQAGDDELSDSGYTASAADAKLIADELTRVTGRDFKSATAAEVGTDKPLDGTGLEENDIYLTDGKLSKSGKGLTLQIGDTSESFNKMTVTVADMHAKNLGISDVDISSQEGAAAAMDKIKAAINQVSDTRGGLGALQNRLDHTINNLGVMRENIQNAESTIRDTDVADEMMAYTKNNILNQSAQAMLAQANQLPQGVLQLLG
jgi:flagellin